MIAWFTTRGANVAIIQCYGINGLRNTLRPHPITSHCHLSSSMILWSRTQEKYFIKEMGGMWRHEYCDQRGNKMCLFLPKKCPVSYGNHLHSTLYLVVFCPSKCYLSLPLEFLALLGFLPAYIWWLREHTEIQVDISWSGSHAKFVCFLMQVTRPQGLFFFLPLTELCLGSQSFPICGNLGSVFSPPDALSVGAFFQSVSRCGCILVYFQHIVSFPELLHNCLPCHLPSPPLPHTDEFQKPVAIAPNLVALLPPAVCAPALKVKGMIGLQEKPLPNELPADSQMLWRSGPTIV